MKLLSTILLALSLGSFAFASDKAPAKTTSSGHKAMKASKGAEKNAEADYKKACEDEKAVDVEQCIKDKKNQSGSHH